MSGESNNTLRPKFWTWKLEPPPSHTPTPTLAWMESLLQRYRRDRRKLLDFILSSAPIHQGPTSSAPTANISDSDLDVLSADYVLDCLNSG